MNQYNKKKVEIQNKKSMEFYHKQRDSSSKSEIEEIWRETQSKTETDIIKGRVF